MKKLTMIMFLFLSNCSLANYDYDASTACLHQTDLFPGEIHNWGDLIMTARQQPHHGVNICTG
jgi:hypothetical protein